MNVTRRDFFVSSLALLGSRPLRGATAGRVLQVFVGSYSNASGEMLPTDFGTHRGPNDLSRGISTFEFDTENGVAGPVRLAAECSSPINLILHSNGRFLYACRGQQTRVDGQNAITAYAIEPQGILRELNTVKCGGGGPTVGTVDRAGRHLLTTNFSTDSIVCIRLNPDGSLGDRTAMIGSEPPAGELPELLPPGPLAAPGADRLAHAPDPDHPEKTKPHAVVLSPTERFAIAAEITANQCRVMRFGTESGTLTTHRLAADAPGAGPRHLAWHPRHRYLYSSGEGNSSISAWQWNEDQGELFLLQNLTCLPSGFSGINHPADVTMHPTGNFVYVTNRGAGTLAGYRIDPETGLLEPTGHTDLGSPACWSLRFDPTGRWALAAALIADEVIVYAVDPESGRLEANGQDIRIILPTCLRWI